MKRSRKRPSTVDRSTWNSQSALHIIVRCMLEAVCLRFAWNWLKTLCQADKMREKANQSRSWYVLWNISIFMCIVFERELNSFNEYFNIFERILWYHKLVRRIRGRILYRNWLLLGISFACLNKVLKAMNWISP